MTNIDDKFFELLRFALETSDACLRLHLREWQVVYQIAKKQTLTAFIGSALGKVEDNLLVEKDAQSRDSFEDLMMAWTGEVVKTARRNKKVNADVLEEFRKLESKGLECCLLKGQGNALLYPNPTSRTSGDIDVWVRYKGQENTDANIQRFVRMVKDAKPDAEAVYHHIDALCINGTSVEIHYRPQFLFFFTHNRNLQRFFNEHADEQFNHKVKFGNSEISIPTDEFNIVFQLSHIYNHLFHEGIGLRQIVDYFYVLRNYCHSKPHINIDWCKVLNNVGLLNIGSAIMWILIDKLGMNKHWAVVAPDEKRGRFVLKEILLSGNFGKYDERNARFGYSKFGRNLQRVVRDFRLVRYFPSEALSEPFFRLWHALWRLRHN